jgi:hypothetical protein
LTLTATEKREMMEALDRLTPAQQQLIKSAILGFGIPRKFERAADSDIVTQQVLENMGDRLLTHHVHSTHRLRHDKG